MSPVRGIIELFYLTKTNMKFYYFEPTFTSEGCTNRVHKFLFYTEMVVMTRLLPIKNSILRISRNIGKDNREERAA